MKSAALTAIAVTALFSMGCSSAPSTPSGTPQPAASQVMKLPDEAPSGLIWTTFTAPDGSFTVEVPGPMKADKNVPGHRFTTPTIPAHPRYDVGYMDIDEKDINGDRAVMAKDLMSGLLKGNKVNYRQAGMYNGQYPSEMASFITLNEELVSAQVFAGKKRLWVMEVILPKGLKDTKRVPVHRFMGSMKVKDEPPVLASGAPAPGASGMPASGGPAASGAPQAAGSTAPEKPPSNNPHSLDSDN